MTFLNDFLSSAKRNVAKRNVNVMGEFDSPCLFIHQMYGNVSVFFCFNNLDLCNYAYNLLHGGGVEV